MSNKEVGKLPQTEPGVGLMDKKKHFKILLEGNISDVRLNPKEEVLVATYPRTGTTLISHIISLLLAGEDRFEEIRAMPIEDRVPYLEFSYSEESPPYIHRLDQFPVPRADKTHLPYRYLKRWMVEDKVPTVVCTRNPKDTLVSVYHFIKTLKIFGPFTGSWNEFFEQVQSDNLIFGSQLDWYKDLENYDGEMLLLKFEDIRADILSAIEQIVHFLKLDVSQEFMEKVAIISELKNMKKDISVNYKNSGFKMERGTSFIRKGLSGEWKKYFTVEQNEWFDEKYKKGFQKLSLDVHYE